MRHLAVAVEQGEERTGGECPEDGLQADVLGRGHESDLGLRAVTDAGGGTRTPDTRIMIPLL